MYLPHTQDTTIQTKLQRPKWEILAAYAFTCAVPALPQPRPQSSIPDTVPPSATLAAVLLFVIKLIEHVHKIVLGMYFRFLVYAVDVRLDRMI